jgi:TonB family protein
MLSGLAQAHDELPAIARHRAVPRIDTLGRPDPRTLAMSLPRVVIFVAVLVLATLATDVAAQATPPDWPATAVGIRSGSPPKFPVSALRECAFGKSMVHVRVDADGRLVEAALQESSGNAALDAAAVKAALSWEYTAPVVDGVAQAGEGLVPVNFHDPCPEYVPLPPCNRYGCSPDEARSASLAELKAFGDELTVQCANRDVATMDAAYMDSCVREVRTLALELSTKWPDQLESIDPALLRFEWDGYEEVEVATTDGQCCVVGLAFWYGESTLPLRWRDASKPGQ